MTSKEYDQIVKTKGHAAAVRAANADPSVRKTMGGRRLKFKGGGSRLSTAKTFQERRDLRNSRRRRED